jgi:uncharacterized membrane protein YdjX (TVP38/TMEM64 family)
MDGRQSPRMENRDDMLTQSPEPPTKVATDAAPAAAPTMDKSGGLGRVILLAVVLSVAAALSYFLPVRSWLRGSGQAHQIIQAMGIWIYPAGILAFAILVACGVPRLLLGALAGIILSFWGGLLVGQCGTMLGYYAVFLFTRWGGRDWALRRWPPLRKWASVVHEHGTMGVILLRQLPIHGIFINLGLGISHVKHRHFLIGTFIGSLPEAIPATLAGAGLVKGSIKMTTGYLTIALVVLAALWIGCGTMLKAMRKTQAGAEIIEEAAILKGEA